MTLAQLIAGTIDAYNSSHGISADEAVAALDTLAALIVAHREDWPVPGSNVVHVDFYLRRPLTNHQLVC